MAEAYRRYALVKIIDATLREGCQSPGVNFTLKQSVDIALALSDLGVDQIECGCPIASDIEFKRVKAVVNAVPSVSVLSHARAKITDIDAVAKTGAEWVGIFIGINEYSRKNRISGYTTKSILNLIHESITYARSIGLRVRFTLEDASRTDDDLILKTFYQAISAGVDRICFGDTVGIMTPTKLSLKIHFLLRHYSDVPLELHLHNDRGMAMANAIVGVEAGAQWLSTSVNGIGERAGIIDTCLTLANLQHEGLRPLKNNNKIRQISNLVSAYARIPINEQAPIIGKNAFKHTSDLHVKAVKKDEMTYNWINPNLYGLKNTTFPVALNDSLESLFIEPKIESAEILRYHSKGPGNRYVMIDESIVSNCNQYCIVREIPYHKNPPAPHVDGHIHVVNSLYLFLGSDNNLSGLKVEVVLGNTTKIVDSPACVFVPAGISHTYYILEGKGYYINHVSGGIYNDSLL